MAVTIVLIFAVVLVVFLVFVSTREGKFHYERSGIIHSTPANIFPYISDLNKGGVWSPYEKKDPNLKKTFTGNGADVGSIMEFEGNSESGSGRLEILKIVPNESVDIQLTMTKPFNASNLVRYSLTPEGEGTRFTWAMSGDGGFLGKLINTLIDCETMVAGDFEIGIQNLKQVVEDQK